MSLQEVPKERLRRESQQNDELISLVSDVEERLRRESQQNDELISLVSSKHQHLLRMQQNILSILQKFVLLAP